MFELSDTRRNIFHENLIRFSEEDCTHLSVPFFTPTEITNMIEASEYSPKLEENAPKLQRNLLLERLAVSHKRDNPQKQNT